MEHMAERNISEVEDKKQPSDTVSDTHLDNPPNNPKKLGRPKGSKNKKNQNNNLPAIPSADSMAGSNRCLVADQAGRELGITRLQDAYSQLAAGYPDGVDPWVLAEAYLAIPGVKTDHDGALQAVRRYQLSESVRERIEQYRRVMGTSRLSLLAHREGLHDEIVDRWRSNPDATVRTTDLLQSLRDREQALGLTPAQQANISVILSNDRTRQALDIASSDNNQDDNTNTINMIASSNDSA